MPVEIEIRKFKDINLKGGTVVDCIPTVSIVTGIVGSHIVSSLGLDQIFAMESEAFPPVSLVFSKKPKFPARGYASEEHKLAVVLTEFTPQASLSRPLAYQLLSCHDEYKCKRIISFEGLPVKSEEGSDPEDEPKVFGLGSTESAQKHLEDAGIEQMETGMLVGVTAILMNEGRWRNREVISLIGEIRSEFSTIRVAARLIEAYNKLSGLPKIDTKPMMEEAEKIESHFEKLQTQAKPVIGDVPMNLYH